MAINVLEILLCCVLFYDYHMRVIVFSRAVKEPYYRYKISERKKKRIKTFDPSDPAIDVARLPIGVVGGDPIITDQWTIFELATTVVLVSNALLCLVTTAWYSREVVPHLARVMRPFIFLVKMGNVCVRLRVAG
jgi:hypothetical protein